MMSFVRLAAVCGVMVCAGCSMFGRDAETAPATDPRAPRAAPTTPVDGDELPPLLPAVPEEASVERGTRFSTQAEDDAEEAGRDAPFILNSPEG